MRCPPPAKNTIAAGSPEGYLDWLKQIHEESHGNSDLVAHFFRRAFNFPANVTHWHEQSMKVSLFYQSFVFMSTSNLGIFGLVIGSLLRSAANTDLPHLTQIFVEEVCHTAQVFLSVVCERCYVACSRGQPELKVGVCRTCLL